MDTQVRNEALRKLDEQLNEHKEKKSIWSFFKKLLPSPDSRKGQALFDDSMAKGRTEPLVNQYDFEALSAVIQDAVKDKDGRNITNLNQSALSAMDFAPIFRSKRNKIDIYKRMYMYPEINQATQIIVNESIVTDDSGETLKLIIDTNSGNEMPIAVQEQFQAAFDMMTIDIFDLDNVIQDLFLKFLIEGELYIEYIMSEDGDAIVDYQILPSYSMIPVFKDGTSTIIGYAQYEDIILNCDDDEEADNVFRGLGRGYDSIMGANNSVWLDEGIYGVAEKSGYNEFLPNEIGYANFGTYGTSVYDVVGYYEAVRKTYNQMSTIDDALAVYRYVRAPETRLWNIFTGSLPPGKADNYLQNVISEFRKDFNYNPSTGEIEQDTVFKSIIDDYFFATDGNGNKTTVDTLSGAMNLDQLNDLDYFKDKLMGGLHIPRSRWDKEAMKEWSSRNEAVTGEEVQLSYFVERLQRNFVNVFKVCFEDILRLNGIDEKYINGRYYSLEFAKRNHWKYWQDVEAWNSKIEMYNNMVPMFYDPENNPVGIFTPDFALKKAFGFSAEEEQTLEDSMIEFKKSLQKEKPKMSMEEWEAGFEKPPIGYKYGSNKKIYEFGKEEHEGKYEFGSEEEEKEYNLYKFGESILEDAEEEVTMDNTDMEDVIFDEEDTYDEQEVYHFGMDEVTYDYGHDESHEDKYNYGQKYLYGVDGAPNTRPNMVETGEDLIRDEDIVHIDVDHHVQEPAEKDWTLINDEDKEEFEPIQLYEFKEQPEEDSEEPEVFSLYEFTNELFEDEEPQSEFLPSDKDHHKYDNNPQVYDYGNDTTEESPKELYDYGENEDELF